MGMMLIEFGAGCWPSRLAWLGLMLQTVTPKDVKEYWTSFKKSATKSFWPILYSPKAVPIFDPD
jgi:hypothetical protein